MKKRKLAKNIIKSITHSWGRFISIMLLMALGSFALVGLTVTGPDMRSTSTHYFEKYNTADITILSDYGIDVTEQEYISKASGIEEIEYLYLKDVTIKDTNISFRIFSKPSKISLYEIEEGRMPESDEEIAIDNSYNGVYNIGDTIYFSEKVSDDSSETLKKHEYKIVGFINSSEILSNLNRGQTTAGTGELQGYAVVNGENFDSSVYMMAKLIFEDTKALAPYTDEYNEKIQNHKEELSSLLSEQQDIRLSSIKSEYQEKIDEGTKKIQDAKDELENARNKLSDAKNELDNANETISNNEKELEEANNKIVSAEKEISTNQTVLKNKQKEYDEGVKELASKKSEYEKSLKELKNKKAELQSGNSQIEKSQQEIDENKENLEEGKKEYENGIANLEQSISKINQALENENLSDSERSELNTQLEEYETKLSQTKNLQEQFLNSKYNPTIKILETKQAELNTKKQELQNAQTSIDEAEKQLQTAKSQIDSANSKLESAKTELSTGNKKLQDAKKELSEAKSKYTSGKNKLEEAKKELESKQEEYNESLSKFQEEEPDALKEIEDSEKKLQDAQKELDEINSPTYSVDNRREMPGGEGYSTYETVSEIVDSLAKVFPVFLYFVAALVTLTTMTRFVGDERINNGTLKSLGYDNKDIIKKFTIYGFIAGMVGTVIGIILGHKLLPFIVYNAYRSGFTLPKIELNFHWKITILAIILSLISSVIPAYIVAKKDLTETTASLLQPKAPKAGTKILLERIKPIWSKMKFTHKVTARNIFRYKNRMFMTIFGVSGATAILFTGFSVKASISGINERQFEDLIKYDIIVALNNDITEDEQIELNNILDDDEIKDYSSIYYEEVTKKAGENNDTQPIKLIVPENTDEFDNYISTINRKTGEKINLADDGVVISERLAEILDLSKGDTFTFIDSKDKERTVKVSDICEMYAGHFIFMNQSEYKNVYGYDFEANAKLILLNDSSLDNTKNQAARFMKLSSVKGVVQNTTLYNQIDTIVKSLDKIMIILIAVAAMLAIVILYNLTNINVEERIRELCTIKVLGFFDKEVTMYIYRETIYLSLFGIIVGWLIGLCLHHYILTVVPPAQVMFSPTVWIGAYIIPFVTITVVSIILKYYVNNKLKNVDMLEALKSVD